MYVLGSATNSSAPLRLQNTCDNDGWDSLGKAYGVSPQAIIQMQPGLAGKTITNASVQAFVKSLPGWSPVNGMYPFDPNQNPGTFDENGNPEGFAHFTSQTQLMLPDMPRLDGKVPSGSGPAIHLPPAIVTVAKKKAPINPLVVGGLVIGGLFVISQLSKKKKAARSQGRASLAAA